MLPTSRSASLSEAELARLVFKAKLAEQAERFDEMAHFMHTVIEHKKSLEANEQKLFDVAYKNHIGRIRTAWKLADASRAKYAGKNQQKEHYAIQYSDELAKKIIHVCGEVEADLSTVASSAADSSSRALYAKMDADFRRYRCEVERKGALDVANAYKYATKVAQGLDPNHPTRMGIALNHSVFEYEIQNDLDEACRIAREALDNAQAIDVAKNRETFLITQLLKDNIDLWRSEQPKVKENYAF